MDNPDVNDDPPIDTPQQSWVERIMYGIAGSRPKL